VAEVVVAPDDPRLEPYRDIRLRNLTRHSGRFVAEGRLLVLRLLASRYRVESVLVGRRHVDQLRGVIPPGVVTLVLDDAAIDQLLGFQFHRGVLGCGLRRPEPRLGRLVEHLRNRSAMEIARGGVSGWTGLLLAGVHDPENVGGMLRCCAALGINDVLIGPGTADPLSRRALRVSMGTSLKLRLYRPPDLEVALEALQDAGVELLASSLQHPSEPLEAYSRRGPVLLMIGNEYQGLAPRLQALAGCRLQIPMANGVDSLNATSATAILLHYLSRLSGGRGAGGSGD
jgi:tRNA G18 (ribose-2'-O)-methylase SpoU